MAWLKRKKDLKKGNKVTKESEKYEEKKRINE